MNPELLIVVSVIGLLLWGFWVESLKFAKKTQERKAAHASRLAAEAHAARLAEIEIEERYAAAERAERTLIHARALELAEKKRQAAEAAAVTLRIVRPTAWEAEHQHDLAAFLESPTGALLCAHARWRHLQAASVAVQTPQDPAAQAAAHGSAETLRLLHAYSGLADLPDLSPATPERSDSGQAEKQTSLHTLLTQSHDD